MAEESREIVVPNGGQRKLVWLLTHKDGQEMLAKLHPLQKTQRLRCACNPASQAGTALVIRRKNERYHIACMPNTGHYHARDTCDFFSEDRAASGGGEYEGAIRLVDDVTEIKVNFALHKATPALQTAPPEPAVSPGGCIKRGSMGLAGLLSQLWNEAGLNVWKGREGRPWAGVCQKLLDVAEGTRLGKRPLCDHLYVQPSSGDRWVPAPPADVEQCQDYFLLLFKVNFPTTVTKFGGVYLMNANGNIIFVNKRVLDAITHRFPRAMAMLTPEGRRNSGAADSKPPKVICLARAEWGLVQGRPCLAVLDAACMLTNWRDIPVESKHELRIADMLVEQRRTFTKPLRYDAAMDVVFPDFILNDAGDQGVPMEVYGISDNPQYEERKQVKCEHYKSSQLPFWEWTPSEGEIPPFPAAVA